MKRKNLITIAIIGILIVGGIIVFDYFSLENQTLRDIDKFYETGKDPVLGEQIMKKINTISANSDRKNPTDRLVRFLQNPKVIQFILDWKEMNS